MPDKLPNSADRMIREVAARQARLERAPYNKSNFWASLSILGIVGWSVTIPTILGACLGIWLDRHLPAHFSWAVTLLFAGLIAGCANAWLQIGGKPK